MNKTQTNKIYDKDSNIRSPIIKEVKKEELLNYLLQRFNDYEVPLKMTAKEVREHLINFIEEYETNVIMKQRNMNNITEKQLTAIKNLVSHLRTFDKNDHSKITEKEIKKWSKLSISEASKLIESYIEKVKDFDEKDKDLIEKIKQM